MGWPHLGQSWRSTTVALYQPLASAPTKGIELPGQLKTSSRIWSRSQRLTWKIKDKESNKEKLTSPTCHWEDERVMYLEGQPRRFHTYHATFAFTTIYASCKEIQYPALIQSKLLSKWNELEPTWYRREALCKAASFGHTWPSSGPQSQLSHIWSRSRNSNQNRTFKPSPPLIAQVRKAVQLGNLVLQGDISQIQRPNIMVKDHPTFLTWLMMIDCP